MNPSSLLAAIVVLMLAAACDESFSPIEPSELDLSVFGYLDVSADTQWIRISPIRPLTQTAPGPLGATVTLEHLGTGRIVELQDSVFRFSPPNSEIGSEGVYLHNFWTTEKIAPEAVYRFVVSPDGEEPSEAVVETPPEYEVEVWLAQTRSERSFVRLVGVKHVAFLGAIAHYYDVCGSGVGRWMSRVGSIDSGTHMIPVGFGRIGREGCSPPQVEKRELLIVGSGSVWPSGREYLPGALGLPDLPSNISNSLGYLGGVLTRLVPFESCQFTGVGAAEDYCKLRYDGASANLKGTVSDVLCSGKGVARASVELRELNPEPPARRKIRDALTDRFGAFSIGALEGGRRYALTVEKDDQYQAHTDTLEFSAGEDVTYDVALRRFECPS